MRTSELFEGIYYVEGGVSADECRALVLWAEGLDKWSYARSGRYENGRLAAIDEYGQARGVETVLAPSPELPWLDGYARHIKDYVRECLGVIVNSVSPVSISRYSKGEGLLAHRDTGVYDTNRIFTSVTFLNDAFLGGELCFPEHNLSIAPKVGDSVVFLSEYLHSVNSFSNGLRYTAVVFLENVSVTAR